MDITSTVRAETAMMSLVLMTLHRHPHFVSSYHHSVVLWHHTSCHCETGHPKTQQLQTISCYYCSQVSSYKVASFVLDQVRLSRVGWLSKMGLSRGDGLCSTLFLILRRCG